MKAQHRHELESNQLALWLETKVEQLRPYTQAIIGVVIAALVLFGVWYYLRHMDTSAEQAASDQLVAAINERIDPAKAFKETAEAHPGTSQAVVARLLMGEQLLRSGSEQLYTNKPEGKKNLLAAAAEFGEVEKSAKDSMLKARAQYGLARAHESLGQLDVARGDYEKLIKEFPASALKDQAEKHLKTLSQQSTKEFYDWFAKQDPQPTAMDQLPGKPGQKPIFDLSDPTAIPQGDLKLPGFDGTPSSTPSTTTPSATDPATPATPSGETTSTPPSDAEKLPPESKPVEAPGESK